MNEKYEPSAEYLKGFRAAYYGMMEASNTPIDKYMRDSSDLMFYHMMIAVVQSLKPNNGGTRL